MLHIDVDIMVPYPTVFGTAAAQELSRMEQHSTHVPIIEAHGLQKRYGNTQAVQGIDLAVYPGEIVGFLGPNGAGKTTTIKMLVGLLRPSAGLVRIGGFDMQRQPLQAKAVIGYVPDQPYLPEKLTAREFLQFLAGLYRLDRQTAAQRGAEWLRLFALEKHADDLLGSYSHGMRQKAALTGALLHNPRAFFLDEPTVGLDPRSARLIKDLLRMIAERGTAVFMSTHILEIAERMCDRVFIIDRGTVIASGTVEELRTGSTASLEDIFLALTGGDAEAAIAEALQ
jgi:ABC-2 type transport system ATP-binding protein